MNNEKGELKIKLGTAIGLFIILILVVAIVCVMFINKNNIKVAENKIVKNDNPVIYEEPEEPDNPETPGEIEEPYKYEDKSYFSYYFPFLKIPLKN